MTCSRTLKYTPYACANILQSEHNTSCYHTKPAAVDPAIKKKLYSNAWKIDLVIAAKEKHQYREVLLWRQAVRSGSWVQLLEQPGHWKWWLVQVLQQLQEFEAAAEESSDMMRMGRPRTVLKLAVFLSETRRRRWDGVFMTGPNLRLLELAYLLYILINLYMAIVYQHKKITLAFYDLTNPNQNSFHIINIAHGSALTKY